MLDYLLTKLAWHVADLGDVRVALPIAAILVVWLFSRRRWQTGLWCAVAVLGCTAIILFLKLAFFAGLRLPAVDLRNPSGHSAVSAVVYGSLAWVVSRELSGWSGRALLLVTGAGVLAIGGSLIAVGAHTLPDVIVGLTLGGASAVAFAWGGYRDDGPSGVVPSRLMLAVAVVVLGIQGWHLVPRFTPSTFMLLVPSVTAAPA